jgi:hypothetical protein
VASESQSESEASPHAAKYADAVRIQHTDLVTQLLGRWEPGDVAYITALSITKDRVRMESIWQRRDVKTSDIDLEPCFRVVLAFEGAVGLKLDWGGPWMRVMGFEIEDISDRQWERIRFLVDDWEHDVIRLSCASITVVEAEPLGPLRYAFE